MSSRQSGLLARQRQQTDLVANAYKDLIQQFMIDTLQIALNRYESFGFRRLARVAEEWERTRREFYPALDPRDPECDVAQAHMDQIFAAICKDHMRPIPFAERYPALRGNRYDTKK